MATKSERLLRDFYIASRNYTKSENDFRREPSDKTFAKKEKCEFSFLLAEQKAGQYLLEKGIIEVCE